jgi:hypothetical protein
MPNLWYVCLFVRERERERAREREREHNEHTQMNVFKISNNTNV